MVKAKETVSQAHGVETRLREMILNMDLGPGERVTERWAEAQFQASRTPIRAALLRLESEGLISREGRGWIVTPLNLQEIEQLFVYREVLESAALRLTAAQTDHQKLDEMEMTFGKPNDHLTKDEAHHVGTTFHMQLASLCGNDFICRGIADAMNRLSRARWLDTEADHDGWEQHLAIIATLRAGNADLAVDHLVSHIRESRGRLVGILENTRRSIRARGALVVI